MSKGDNLAVKETERPQLPKGNDPSQSRPRAKYGASVLVMDSAHSWVICFANLFIFTMNATFARASHICFLSFVETFDVSITTVSLGFTLSLVMFSISSILVTSLIIPKTSERVACFLGNIIGFTCTIFIGLAPNVAVYLLFMGIKGIGSAMVSVSAISMISQYFDKRKSFATAVACCGVAVGSMGSPPVIKLLLENVGLRGTFLLIAGFELHNFCMALLLRPTSRYKTIIREADKHRLDDVMDDENTNEGKESDALVNGSGDVTSPAQDVFETTEPHTHIFEYETNKSKADVEMKLLKFSNKSENINLDPFARVIGKAPVFEVENRTASNGFVLNDKDNNERTSTETTQLNGNNEADMALFESTTKSTRINGTLKSSELLNSAATRSTDDRVDPLVHSPPSVKLKSNSFSNDERTLNPTGPFLPKQCSVAANQNCDSAVKAYVQEMNSSDAGGSAKKSPYGSRAAKTSISSTWSVVSASVNEIALDVELSPQPEHNACRADGDRSKSACVRALHWIHSAFRLELLRTWSLRILLMYSAVGILQQYMSTYLPTMARREGLTPDEISLMLIVGGGVDFASRLAIGAFSDLQILRPTQIVAISQFIIGTTCHFSRFFNTAPTLMGLAVILGLFAGCRQSLQTLVCLEFMGQENFKRGYGFQLMVGTLTLSIHHPLLSSILEATGSFATPLHYVGVAAYLSGISLLLQPMTKRLDEKVKANQQNTQTAMD